MSRRKPRVFKKQKIYEILQEVTRARLEGAPPVVEVYRKHEVTQQQVSTWEQKFGRGGKDMVFP